MRLRVAQEESALVRMAGVPGREPAVDVELLEPHQGKPLLPTGHVVDVLRLEGRSVEATLVSAGNPTVFVRAGDVDLRGTEPWSRCHTFSLALEGVSRQRFAGVKHFRGHI